MDTNQNQPYNTNNAQYDSNNAQYNPNNVQYNPNGPAFNTPMQPPANNGLSVGEWMLTLFLTGIPCVGFIMLIVWAAGEDNARRNYARATLIWMVICVVISIILYAIIFAAGLSMLSQYN